MRSPTMPRQQVTVRLAPLVALQLATAAHRRGLQLQEFCTILLGAEAYRITADQEDCHRRAAETTKALRRALQYGPPIDNPSCRRI